MKAATSAHGIANALRAMILNGELAGGEPLKQDALAARLNISRIPLREALLMLQADGLVTLNPNRSATVTALSAAEAREIYVMRIALETAALKHALPNLQPVDFARARGTLAEIDHTQGTAAWSALNWEFHRTLYAPCNMPRLMTEMQALHANVARYFLLLEEAHYRKRSQKDHRDLLRACEARDAGRAIALLAGQLELSCATLVAHLSSSPSRLGSAQRGETPPKQANGAAHTVTRKEKTR